MKNINKAKCALCRRIVLKDKGIFEIIPFSERVTYKRWRVLHDKCHEINESNKHENN